MVGVLVTYGYVDTQLADKFEEPFELPMLEPDFPAVFPRAPRGWETPPIFRIGPHIRHITAVD